MKMTLEQAIERLAKFETPDGIAAFLRREGIQGRQANPNDCPLANWFKQATGNPDVTVTSRSVQYFQTVNGSPNGTDGRWLAEYMPLPEAATQFIRKFDCGRYKYLRKVDLPL